MLSFIAFNPCKLCLCFNASMEEQADSLSSVVFVLQQILHPERGKSSQLVTAVLESQDGIRVLVLTTRSS